MDSTTQVITTLIILLALVVSVIVTQFIRRRKEAFPMRVIPAYDAIPLLVGEAIEAGRPMHVSFGSAGIGGSNTALALASAELFYQVARAQSRGSTMLTVSDPSALPLGYGTLRRALTPAARATRSDALAAACAGIRRATRSLAFAAALTGMLGDERVSGNVLVGSFGPELALVLEAAARRRQIVDCGQRRSRRAGGRLCDGGSAADRRGMFVAGAYLGDSATQRGSVVTLDVLRWLLILGMLIATAQHDPRAGVDALTRLLTGRLIDESRLMREPGDRDRDRLRPADRCWA